MERIGKRDLRKRHQILKVFMKLKLLTVLGTRPEIIKMGQVLQKADKYFDHVIAHTGQNFDYELNEVFFNDLGLRKPDHFLSAAGSNPATTIANVIIKVDELIDIINTLQQKIEDLEIRLKKYTNGENHKRYYEKVRYQWLNV